MGVNPPPGCALPRWRSALEGKSTFWLLGDEEGAWVPFRGLIDGFSEDCEAEGECATKGEEVQVRENREKVLRRRRKDNGNRSEMGKK